jgi:preprotein translocase subunit SecY
MTAGTMLMVWMGELITERGIGNGISLLIFAGIVSRIPAEISQLLFTFDVSQIPLFLMFIAAGLLVIAGVVVVTEAERPIPVTYAKRVRGMKVYGGTSTYLPLRVNQAGVIPIIFALSLLLFPQMIFSALAKVSNTTIAAISANGLTLFNNSWFYASIYFLLVFAFTYFYTAVTFDPQMISENLQRSGAFIPGVRPGQPTADFIQFSLDRVVLVGAVFIVFIAVVPDLIMKQVNIPFFFGGTSLLIAVGVALDTMKQIESHLLMRHYEGFMKDSKLKSRAGF